MWKGYCSLFLLLQTGLLEKKVFCSVFESSRIPLSLFSSVYFISSPWPFNMFLNSFQSVESSTKLWSCREDIWLVKSQKHCNLALFKSLLFDETGSDPMPFRLDLSTTGTVARSSVSPVVMNFCLGPKSTLSGRFFLFHLVSGLFSLFSRAPHFSSLPRFFFHFCSCRLFEPPPKCCSDQLFFAWFSESRVLRPSTRAMTGELKAEIVEVNDPVAGSRFSKLIIRSHGSRSLFKRLISIWDSWWADPDFIKNSSNLQPDFLGENWKLKQAHYFIDKDAVAKVSTNFAANNITYRMRGRPSETRQCNTNIPFRRQPADLQSAKKARCRWRRHDQRCQ